MFNLALKNVTRRLGQSLVTALVVFLSVTMLCTSSAVVSSFEAAIGLSRDRLGADLMVLPAGASSSAQTVLFTAQPVNIYLPQEALSVIGGTEGVSEATPQFFTQTVDQSCCSVVGVTRIVGIDAQTDFIVDPWLQAGSVAGLGDDQIILGSSAPEIPGQQASILSRTFTVATSLEETGTSMDETIFMDIDAAREIAAGSPYLEGIWNGTDPFDSVSCVMVKLEPGADAQQVADRIIGAYPGVVVTSTSEIISGVSSQLDVAKIACAVFLGSIVLMAALALAGRFSALVAGRMKELGLMRTMGINKAKVLSSILMEIGLVTLAGAIAGVIVSGIASGIIVSHLHEAFSLPGAPLELGSLALIALIGLSFAALLDVVALIEPFLRILKSDPQETLARGDL